MARDGRHIFLVDAAPLVVHQPRNRPRMNANETALVTLLADDDESTVALIKSRLIARGLAALPELRSLAGTAPRGARKHIREIIHEIEELHAEEVFGQICARFGEHGDLEEAAWRLSVVLDPGCETGGSRRLLDKWGKEVASRLPAAETAEERVELLAEFLHIEQGLIGNEHDYYEIENSVLTHVLETRLGLPLTLSLIYLFVAKRAGLKLDGISLPGHFCLRHEDIFFDPFHGGRRLRFDDCKHLLAKQGLHLEPEHLEPATPRQMLARMLANILHVANEQDKTLAARLTHWLSALKN